MIALAPEFAAWRAQLERFPEELALGLAPIMRQLWAALDGIGYPSTDGAEPDGIGGVSQRGPFERLLTSQWLLASELPDEFLRRAAMHELMYLQSAFREPKVSRRLLLAIDSGPSQLGSPRLAHIALLLVLERRAQMARVELFWGVIQRPTIVHTRCEQADIEALLESRIDRDPLEADRDILLETFKHAPKSDSLIWVGGKEHCRLGALVGGQQLCVSDPMLRENDRIRIGLISGGRERELSLRLPPPPVRTRLIRQPFQCSLTSFPLLQSRSEELRFAADGRRILSLQANRIEAHLPTPAPNYRPRVFVVPEGATLAAYGWQGKGIWGLTRSEKGYELEWRGRKFAVRFSQKPFGYFKRLRLGIIIGAGGRSNLRVFICDPLGTLFVAVLGPGTEAVFRPVLDNVLDLRWRRSHVACVCEPGAGEVEVGTISPAFSIGMSARFTCAVPTRIIYGFNRVLQTGCHAVCTHLGPTPPTPERPTMGGRWAFLACAPRQNPIELTDRDQAIACIPLEGNDWALLTYNLAENRLEIVSNQHRRLVRRVLPMATPPLWDELNARLLFRDVMGKLQLIHVDMPRTGSLLPVTPQESA